MRHASWVMRGKGNAEELPIGRDPQMAQMDADGEDGFTAENAEGRRGKKMGTGITPWRERVVLEKLEWEARLQAAAQFPFSKTTAQPSRRAIPVPLCGLGVLCG